MGTYMTDKDVALFGAMMFLAGENRARGGTPDDLEKGPGKEQMREAYGIAETELASFKRQAKRIRWAS